MFTLIDTPSGYVSYVLLLIRVFVGFNFLLGRGYRHLITRRRYTVESMSKYGVPSAATGAAAILNFFGAIFLIIGLMVPVVAFFFAIEMGATAYLQKYRMKTPYFGHEGRGYELNFCYLVFALAMIVLGAGSFSLDRFL